MNCRKIDLYTRYEQEPTDEQRTAFRELVRDAARHTPIAYLLGEREFFSLAFEVGPAVLIPRPETEALVQRMVDLCRAPPERNWHILDLGTGTGCVAVAIARYAANASLVAGDVSPEAVAVAERNIARHNLQERVRAVVADCVALPAEVVPDGGFHAIVTNPPYISEPSWARLPPHIRDHEPRIALTLDGSDGLVMYRRLAVEAPTVLAAGGVLLAEIGHDQLPAVRQVFEQTGTWRFVTTHRDSSDPHERVVEFAYERGKG
jgi:release factor glutamine methyltransferase